MTMQQIINAYRGLNELYGLPLPMRTAHAVYMQRRKLEAHYKFEEEREKALLDELRGKAENGALAFPDAALAQEFQARMQEGLAMEIDEEITPATVNMSELGDVRLRPEVIGWLDGIVKFEE